ncbi:hypothetical protein PG996_004527 [Apiospora saccharicola]|uniref:Uncharacterized protein n=1 Tax=Apiospora saccharicola TaxID=335842 RepID=A0ABR1W4J7_9PEZI
MDGDALNLKGQVWQPLGKTLFNGDPSSNLDHAAFADYYTKQWGIMARQNSGSQYPTPIRCYDICRLIEHIRAGKSRVDIVAELRADPSVNASLHTDQDYQNHVNLALRLTSMMKFGVVKRQIMPRRCLEWSQGSFQEFLVNHFGKQPFLSHDWVRIPKSFQAWNIEKIGGIRMCFTDNLADHLLLVEDQDDLKLLIFHHVSFLEYKHDAIFPDGLVDETLRTLALLFPEAQFGLILKQAYDDATPRTISQWWHDRRNGVQWYTFWVAILVLILTTLLGLVQCVESALQVYKAFVPS